MLDEAIRFMMEVHRGQTRDQDTPYHEHPLTVMRLLVAVGVDDPEILTAAVLHDVMEDGGVTRKDLEGRFGHRVAELVVALTRSNSESREDYYGRLKRGPKEAVLIKCFDRLHNLSELYLSREVGKVERYLRDTAKIVDVLVPGEIPDPTDR